MVFIQVIYPRENWKYGESLAKFYFAIFMLEFEEVVFHSL